MNSREQPDLPPTPSYASPNPAQVGQGAMYYGGRQLTADEILTAELSRDATGGNLADGPNTDQQHNNAFGFPPNQQVGVDPNHDLSYGDQSARRKRSKVSRACDECRRKKVRCDATSESGVETCSNCRRLGVACQFSRVPMKRGPSKGYIKELAERLNTLESQMQPGLPHQDMQYQGINEVSSPRAYHEFSPPMDGSLLGRKRTFSMSEGIHGLPLGQTSLTSRGQGATVGETAATLPDSYPLFNINIVQNKMTAPYWNEDGREHDLTNPLSVDSVVGILSQSANEATISYPVDEGALKTYYDKIHPILPILPHSKEKSLAILHQCNRHLQEVFAYALYSVTHTNIERVQATFHNVESVNSAIDLLSTHLRDPHNLRTLPVNLIWIQTLCFLVIDCDKRGPDNMHGKDGVPKQTLVDHLAILAYKVAKQFEQNRDPFPDLQDVDSDANLARREWFAASILCRWHQVGIGERDIMEDDLQDIHLPSDPKFMGFAASQLAAYSSELAAALRVVETDPEVLSVNPRSKKISRSLLFHMLRSVLNIEQRLGTVDRLNTPPGYFEALGPQVYWTINLYITRPLYVFAPYEVIHSAEALVKEMHKDILPTTRLPSPLDIYSLALATLTLLEASKLPLCAEFCWEILNNVEQILDRRAQTTALAGEFDDLFSTPHWDRQLRSWIEAEKPTPHNQPSDSITQNQNNTTTNGTSAGANPTTSSAPLVGPNEQRSLQHLADLAVGAEGVAAGSDGAGGGAVNISLDGGAAADGTSGGGINNVNNTVDFSLALRRGFMNVLSVAPIPRH
ncbi:putative C6 finger domain protein [Talaromyces proteolyticus]|uniref:C6 finger domain protein n=1 Tax=Talaromyces proteolyticus TaxID=1131652 RepID=A0AAD4L5K6_9EURO|nr:putative C6 finger domain protein [Talaromyces proteolyticus]KAH8705005.1 putative C6 finger domain protein [Talaromyces proteolyticus]